MKHKIGQRVKFRGTADSQGRMISVHKDGSDTFEATVANYPFGICYGLEFDDGTPVGLPFHDDALESVVSA